MNRYLPFVPFFLIATLHADVPATLHHQGRVAVNNVNFTGNGDFKFLLFTDSDADHSSGNETAVWKNDDATPSDLTEPATAVSLTVTNGLYSMRLGEAPQAALPASLIPPVGEQLYLRTWFDNGINGSQQLTPDQQLASVPFAKHADITGQNLSALINDAGFITEESLVTTTETEPVAPDLATLNSGPGVFSNTFSFSQTFPEIPEIVLGNVANLTNPVVSNVSTTGFDLTFDYDTSTQTSTLPATTPWTEFDAVPIGGILGVFYIDGETQTNTYDTGVDKENVFGPPTDVVVTDVTDFPDLVFRTLNGSSWGTPTILGNVLASSPAATQTIDAAIINGRPAVAYLEHAPLTNTPNPINPNVVQINSTTSVNLTYRTMDPSATNWQSAVTASPLLALNNTSSGSYTSFAGNPPQISLASISGRPAILSSINGFASFLRANNADGTSWSPTTTVEVNSQPVQALSFSNLLEIGGNPAFAYMEALTPATSSDPALLVRFVSATDPSGSSWNAPVTLWSVSQDDLAGGVPGPSSSLQQISTELRLIDGQPAVAFSLPVSSLTGLFYTRSQDSSGTAWQPAAEIASHGAGFPTSGVITTARLSDDSGLPRISFNKSPDIVEISGDQADGGTWSTPSTIASGVNGKHQSGSVGQADFLLTSSATSFQSPLSLSNVTSFDDVIYRAPLGGSIDAVTNPSPSLTWTATDPADVELVNQSLSLNGTDLSISAGNTIDLSPAIITDHGSLTGLLDDDHPQYLLGDGSEPFGGDLDLGGNNLTNVANLTVTGTPNFPAASISVSELASDVMVSGENVSLLTNDAGYLDSIAGLNVSALTNDAGYIPTSGNATIIGNLTVKGDFLFTQSLSSGVDTSASGTRAIALGQATTASGDISTALGNNTEAESFAETVLGQYDTDYAPTSTSIWKSTDRLFVVGKGVSDAARADALVMRKNGDTELNGELCVNDDVLSPGDFKYKTAKTLKKLIPAAAFQPMEGSTPTRASSGALSEGSGLTIVAPLMLPEGATIQSIKVHCSSTSGTLQVRPWKTTHTPAGTPAGVQAFSMSIPDANDTYDHVLIPPHVVQPDSSYSLEVKILSLFGTLYGAEVTYTLDTLTP